MPRYTKHDILHDLQIVQGHLIKARGSATDILKGANSGVACDCRDHVQNAMFKINEIADKICPAVAKLKTGGAYGCNADEGSEVDSAQHRFCVRDYSGGDQTCERDHHGSCQLPDGSGCPDPECRSEEGECGG